MTLRESRSSILGLGGRKVSGANAPPLPVRVDRAQRIGVVWVTTMEGHARSNRRLRSNLPTSEIPRNLKSSEALDARR